MKDLADSIKPAGSFCFVPSKWDEDPTPQLQALRDEIHRQWEYPEAQTRAFMPAAYAAIQRLPHRQAPAIKAEALVLIAAFYHLQDQDELAADAAVHAIKSAVLGSHRSLEARARKVYATVLKTMYQLGASLREFTHALELAQLDGDATAEHKILNNFAGWYLTAGQFADALAMFEQLAFHYRNEKCGDGLFMALSNAALTALRMRELEKALALIESSMQYVDNPVSGIQKLRYVQHALTYCQLLVVADRHEEAAARAKEAVATAASPGCPKSAQILADLTEAVVVFPPNAQSIDRMIALAKAHSELATELTLDAAVLVYEHCGLLDKALEYQYERIRFQEKIKFSQLRKTYGRRSPEEGESVAKVAELQMAIDRRIAELVNAAVSQSVRSGYDHARIFRVSRLCELFAMSEGWSLQRAREFGLTGKLIDIGMMVVPADLLLKPRELLHAERRPVLEHARFGAELLQSAHLTILAPCIPVARFHHEKWNGEGPSGLIREAIPLEARMVALCDCFDALSHRRPWRDAFSTESALDLILDAAGTHFDPSLATRFVDFIRREVIAWGDLDPHLATEAWENDFVRTQLRAGRLVRGERGTAAI
jgi:putative two-component system response regulator